MPPPTDLTARDGLLLFSPAAALVRASETLFKTNPIEIRVVLSSIPDAAEVLRPLLDGGRSVVAGRLAAAFRHSGRSEVADEIVAAMKAAGYDVRETDPFADTPQFAPVAATTAPIVGRIQALWTSMRSQVLGVFPRSPGLPQDTTAYLRSIDEGLSKRCLPLPVDRRVQRFGWVDPAGEVGQLGSGPSRLRPAESRGPGRTRLLAGLSSCQRKHCRDCRRSKCWTSGAHRSSRMVS